MRFKKKMIYRTLLRGASPAIRAAAALPALFSSRKLIVELISRRTTIPTKSCQSGGCPPPLAKTMAMMAAISITQDRGFHMNPKNFKNLLSCFSSSLLGPKTSRRLAPSSSERPSLVHFRLLKTSSMGMLS